MVNVSENCYKFSISISPTAHSAEQIRCSISISPTPGTPIGYQLSSIEYRLSPIAYRLSAIQNPAAWLPEGALSAL